MATAVCLIREQPHYRRDAFVKGLAVAGYHVLGAQGAGHKPRPGDLLVTWNLYANYATMAAEWERCGGTVVVCENGYIGHDNLGRQRYAMAIGGHNGSGSWIDGHDDRWDGMGIDLKPWRKEGDHIVAFIQRGIGSPLMASPPDFERRVLAGIAKHTKRRVVFSKHPGDPACNLNVTEQTKAQINGAHAVITWSSARAVRALIEGIPVFYLAPHWICEGASSRDLSMIESPPMPDRLPTLRRMAWAQWTIAEIASGLPFETLLKEVACS